MPGVRAKSAAALLVLAIALAGEAALAAETWTVEATGAVATLPDPRAGADFTGGQLVCHKQDWHFVLAGPVGDVPPTFSAPAELRVDRQAFQTRAEAGARSAELAVPYAAIEPLKMGASMRFAIGGKRAETAFSLRGSRNAIAVLEQRCRPRDLPEKGRIVFSYAADRLALARRLRKESIVAFKVATSQKPDMATAMIDLDAGRRLFFVRLCGTSWYFGLSGCNMSAYAQDAQDAQDGAWRVVLDTEGAAFYRAEEMGDEVWPRLVSRAPRGPDEKRAWVWGGKTYQVEDPVPQWALRD